jgi:hypothetical protein
MAYNDFTLEALKKQFGLQTNEREDYFSRAAPLPVSDFLREYLIPTVYGALTTGTYWKFLRLSETTVSVEMTEYHVQDAERIVGILVAMIQEASTAQQTAARIAG